MPSPLARPAATLSRRAGALFAAVAVLVSLLVALAGPAAADPTPPPNPSDAQIGAAQASKDQLAAQVGALTAQLTQQQAQVTALQGESELAEQKVAYTQQQLTAAQDAATAAKQDVATAQQAVEQARSAFNASVRANYTQGGVQGGAGALLGSEDPDEVLQSSALEAYVTDHQVDGIGQLDRATVAKANADARARTAVATQTQLAADAAQALVDAQVAEAAAAAQQQALAVAQADTQTQLATAFNALQVLQGQRQTYNDYLAEQARQAAAAAAAAAAEAQRREAAAAAAAKSSGSGSSSSGGSSGGSSSGGSSAPSGGAWSAAKGQDAANRALKWVDTPYAFAGGGYSGPSYGVCQAGAARNDCHVYGFDCSGLAMYGWAPYIHMDHYAATQYNQAGRFHPSTSQLMPGDLLFYGGSAKTIHHVAIYIGGGSVVQAPQSGDHVRVTALGNMGSDYYGATRPLS